MAAAFSGAIDARPPSIERAEEHRLVSSVAKRVVDPQTRKVRFERYGVCATTPSQMGEICVGVALYFSFLKWMGLITFLICLFVVTHMVLNFFGFGYATVTYNSLSLGNLGTAAPPMVEPILDSIYSAFYLILLAVTYHKLTQMVPTLDENTASPADYTISVTNIPKDVINPAVYAEHFGEFGKVAEVTVALDNVEMIGLQEDRLQVEKNYRIAEARLRAGVSDQRCCACFGTTDLTYYGQQLALIDGRVGQLKQITHFDAVEVFVSFESEKSRDKCLYAYQPKHLGHLLCSCCCYPHKPFRGMNLHVERATEPTNVTWRNLSVSPGATRLRQVLTGVVTFFLIVGGIGVSMVVLFLKLLYSLDTSCLSADWQALLANTVCLSRVAFAAAISVGGSVVLLIVNLIITVVMRKLTSQEGHHTVTAEESSYMVKLFAAQFLSTGIGIMLSGLFYMWWLNGFAAFPSFNPNWYTVVGDFATVTMFINAVVPKVLDLLRFWVASRRRDRAIETAVTQQELNDAFEGPEFMLAPRLAYTMMTMYIALMFGAGVPLMFWICLVDLFLTYWVDKVYLFRLAKQPPAFDEHIVLRAVRWLAWAIVVHLFFSFFFYGAQRGISTQIVLVGVINILPPGVGAFVASLSLQQLPSLITLCALTFVLILVMFGRLLVFICRNTCCPQCCVDKVEDSESRVPFTAVAARLRQPGELRGLYDPPFARDGVATTLLGSPVFRERVKMIREGQASMHTNVYQVESV